MSYDSALSVRTHDLLEIDAQHFLAGFDAAPTWVVESLQRSPFVVVRRGVSTQHGIPVGARGSERNQRWPARCSAMLVESVITPSQLKSRIVPDPRIRSIPALSSLEILKERWKELDHSWGPIGSIGFELATGTRTAKSESDLDIVLYAPVRITADLAKSLCAQAADLTATVDIRVEAPLCGFSLNEYARQNLARMLLRTPSGIMLGIDPWDDEIPVAVLDQVMPMG
jgi:phosphoribosyl-dephospho-CoA transferase